MVPLGLATLPPRRGLLYDEQRKTGSGALRHVLPAAVSGCQIAWDGPGGSVYCPIGVSSCNVTEACYVAPGPRCGGSRELWRTHFVISSTLRKWYYTSDVLIKQATGWLINDLRTFGYKPMRR